MAHKLPFSAHLRRLTCHREGSGWRKTEPYLWTIFFKIDGEHLRLTETFKIEGEVSFKFAEGSHGNLGVSSMEAGETIEVPLSTGLFQSELQPIDVPFFNYKIPGIIGIVAVLMEKENVSRQGAEAGHKALNDYVRRAVNDAVQSFDVKEIDVENIQDSIRVYFSQEVESFVEGIEEAVADAVRDAQNIFQNIWSLIDRDNLVGYRIWDVNHSDLEAHDFRFPLKVRWQGPEVGDWELTGEINAKDLKPSFEVAIE